MQGYTDPALETVAARSAHQASASAQIGEAPTSEASNMTRSGAAARLDMEAAAAALPDGLSSACLARDASFDMGAFDQDVPAQNVPGSVAEVGKECETGESSKTTLLHVSDWSLDDWLTSHRRPEDLPGVEVDKISGVPCYKDPNRQQRRHPRRALSPPVVGHAGQGGPDEGGAAQGVEEGQLARADALAQGPGPHAEPGVQEG